MRLWGKKKRKERGKRKKELLLFWKKKEGLAFVRRGKKFLGPTNRFPKNHFFIFFYQIVGRISYQNSAKVSGKVWVVDIKKRGGMKGRHLFPFFLFYSSLSLLARPISKETRAREKNLLFCGGGGMYECPLLRKLSGKSVCLKNIQKKEGAFSDRRISPLPSSSSSFCIFSPPPNPQISQNGWYIDERERRRRRRP